MPSAISHKPTYEVSFVIPFHNEKENAGPMLDRVLQFGQKAKLNFEIVPINDCSSDNTGEILDRFAKTYKNIHPVHRKDGGELGNTMGLALQIGTQKANGKIIIWTMGDLSDDTQTYQDIIDKLNSGYDMVFGSRYMPGGSRGNLDATKAFFSSKGTLLAKLLFNIKVNDITNAFRGFKKQVFIKVKPQGMGFDISPEFAIKAHKKGFKLGEVPTVYTNRERGLPKFKLWKMIRSYLFIYAKLFFEK